MHAGETTVVSGPSSQSSALQSAPPEGPRSPDPAQTLSSRAFPAGPASTHQLRRLRNNPPGCAEDLGMAIDMADLLQSTAVGQSRRNVQIKDVTIQALTRN